MFLPLRSLGRVHDLSPSPLSPLLQQENFRRVKIMASTIKVEIKQEVKKEGWSDLESMMGMLRGLD